MTTFLRLAAVLGLIVMIPVMPATAAEPTPPAVLQIDIPFAAKEAKIVFNMSQPTFAGDQSIGLAHMKLVVQRFKAEKTPLELVAVFHGTAGYMLLGDAAYNKTRRTERGNPFKDLVADLQREGVQFEECGQTAKTNGWVNADLLPGVKVNAGANLRIVQLVQSGFVQMQP